MAPTSLAVIIPTLNAASLLEKQVQALRDQTEKPGHILVVDSGSTDETVSLARHLEVDLLTIDPGSFDHGTTRNLGAEHTTAQTIIFMTQDALPVAKDTICNLVKPLCSDQVVVSYARQIAEITAAPGEKYLRLANYPPRSKLKSADDIPALGIKTFQSSNVCAAYRRAEFEALGCFPAPVVSNEDMLFAAKAIFAGYSVYYCAEALVNHTHHNNLLKLFRRYFDIAASLDHDPRVKACGNAEAKGFEFLKNQFVYLQKQKQLSYLPLALVESAAKYCGYKAGLMNSALPHRLNKHLGLNRSYWEKERRPEAGQAGRRG